MRSKDASRSAEKGLLPMGNGTSEGDALLGQCLDGAFVLHECIARSPGGSVYRAEQVPLGRTVAVKVLALQVSRNEELRQRFEREAAAMGRMHHPNVVSIFQHGCTDQGQPYIVMEHVSGRSLREIISGPGHRRGMAGMAQPYSRVAEVMSQVLSALEEAHSNGVIHGDLKPENILVRELSDGRTLIKVTDFGIARLVYSTGGTGSTGDTRGTRGEATQGSFDLDGEQASRTPQVFGTAEYIAPEVIYGAPPDRAADIYAAGAIVHELLTGEVPFVDDSLSVVIAKHLEMEVAPISQRFPKLEISPELDGIVMHALAKEPKQRFSSAAAFRDALQAVGSEPGMRCHACGAGNQPSFRFCATCGVRLQNAQSRAETARAAIEHERTQAEQKFRAGGNVAAAQAALGQAIGAAIRQGDPALMIDCYLTLAQILADAQKIPAAIAELEEAIIMVTAGGEIHTVGGPDNLWNLQVLLADLYYQSGRHRDALSLGARALISARQASSAQGRKSAQDLLLRLQAYRGRTSDESSTDDVDARPVLFTTNGAGGITDGSPVPVLDDGDTAPWVLLEKSDDE